MYFDVVYFTIIGIFLDEIIGNIRILNDLMLNYSTFQNFQVGFTWLKTERNF